MYQARPPIAKATTSQIQPVCFFFFGGTAAGGVAWVVGKGGCVEVLIIYLSRFYKVCNEAAKHSSVVPIRTVRADPRFFRTRQGGDVMTC